MTAASKPNFHSPWSFASGFSAQPTPRWWKKRIQLKPSFLELLDDNGFPHGAESLLWGHGVSNAHIAEFFCLVARYGRDAVTSTYFTEPT